MSITWKIRNVINFYEKKTNMNNIEITAIFELCDKGGFIAHLDEIPGINSQGDTLEEAKENLADAVNLVFAERRSNQKRDKNQQVKKLITQTLSFSL